MKSFRINYFRRSDNEPDDMQPDELTVFDQVEFDVEDGNETALLRLFGDFVAENGYEVLSISTIDEVPFDGYEDYLFQNTYMDRMNTVATSAHSFLSTLAIGGVERNDDMIDALIICGKAILETHKRDACYPHSGDDKRPCYRSGSRPDRKCPVRRDVSIRS